MAGGLWLMAACASPDAFECASSVACDVKEDGLCESDGHCSYRDPTCDSGRRYGGLSGDRTDECVGGAVAEVDAMAGDGTGSGVASADAAGETTPSNRILVPGVLEAEDYRDGGEGVGYHELTTGNLSSGCLDEVDDDVDLKQLPGGTCVIAHWAADEWVAYDVDVATTGRYSVAARLARDRTDETRLRVEEDGTAVGSVTVSDTGDWETMTTVTFVVPLSAGPHVLTLVNEVYGLDLDSMTFSGPLL
jgi:hypothetical protein